MPFVSIIFMTICVYIQFGEYVSPNPKPIPFGIKFKPDPLIKIVTKTDSKIEPNQEINDNHDDNPYLDQDLMDGQKTKFSAESNKVFEDRHQVKKGQPTPLKIKVSKQQKEINFLQSELLKLRLENEKLKSLSTSTSPQNEETALIKHKSSKHIVFDENVQVMDELENEQDSFLSDNVSKVRSTRNSTPFKGKPKEKESKFKSIQQKPAKKRSDYRITPIPQQRRRRIVFKSKLQSICDDQAPNKENISIAETAETPKNVQTLETPKGGDGKKVDVEVPSEKNSFNLGHRVSSSESATPSFLETPDVINTTQLTSNGNGASNVVTPSSPILTPVKGMTNSKRFEFSWNKKR